MRCLIQACGVGVRCPADAFSRWIPAAEVFPWVSQRLPKAAKPTTTTCTFVVFFPVGKNSCPDRPPRPLSGGGCSRRAEHESRSPAGCDRCSCPEHLPAGGESPGKGSPWELWKVQLQPSRRCSHTLPDDLLGL